VTKGGDAANIVPAHTSARFMIRSEKIGDLDSLRAKVRRCFEAGAIATGAKLDIIGGDKPYTEMRYDPDMNAFYKRNAESLGRKFPDLGALGERLTASTDMGNVSLAVPSIHPMIGIDSAPASNHQPEFTKHCVTPVADQALIDGAVAMAWTVIDMATDDATRERLIRR
jgi:metal-dependent amidase/aminoacylase/carboxypeptidase family protein